MNLINAAKLDFIQWCHLMGIDTREDLNAIIESGGSRKLINLSEARQERQYAHIADQIFWRSDECKIVALSGPSSSGKTSSALRIAQQTQVIGLNPIVIELDNFFVNREDTPLDENGEKDYESLDAVDVKTLAECLDALLSGEEVELPKFDFKSGHRYYDGSKIRLKDGDILFMEGIHGLNPALYPNLDTKKIFKVYISALTCIPGKDEVGYTSSDKRLLRRIIRDSRTRGISPEDNILRWPSVRRGEEKNIFPFKHNADMVLNSSTIYDIPMLKYYVEPLLYEIKESSPAYEKARFLLEYMSSISALKPADLAAIPPTSIMREFIGGQIL